MNEEIVLNGMSCQQYHTADRSNGQDLCSHLDCQFCMFWKPLRDWGGDNGSWKESERRVQ